MVSSIDLENGSNEVKRKVKEPDSKWSSCVVKQPSCIYRYNKYMNGVDRSDQYLAKYNLLWKCLRWWKTLFFHMIDISLVNAFILFQSYRKANPKIVPLQRAKSFSVLEFREAVIRQILGLEEFGTPPVAKPATKKCEKVPKQANNHFPIFGDKKRNCKHCYMKSRIESKIFSYCPDCDVYLHVTKEKNCFFE